MNFWGLAFFIYSSKKHSRVIEPIRQSRISRGPIMAFHRGKISVTANFSTVPRIFPRWKAIISTLLFRPKTAQLALTPYSYSIGILIFYSEWVQRVYTINYSQLLTVFVYLYREWGLHYSQFQSLLFRFDRIAKYAILNWFPLGNAISGSYCFFMWTVILDRL